MELIRGRECPHCGHREWKDITEERRGRNHELWSSGLIPDRYHSNVQGNHYYKCANCDRVLNASSPMKQPQS